MRWLLVVLAICGCRVFAAPEASTHFMFCRHNEVNGTALTDTLVLGAVTPEGFVLQDLFTKNNLHVGLRLLGVYGGKAYLLHIGDLLCVDIAEKKCTRIAENCSRFAQVQDRLFAVRNGEVVEYNFTRQAWRRVTAKVDFNYGSDIAASPDGKWLAFYGMADKAAGSIAFQLDVLATDTGQVTPVGKPLHYTPSALSGSIAIGGPLAWLDAGTLITVRTDAKITEDEKDVIISGDIVNYLVAVAVPTGEMQDVSPIPGRGFDMRLEFFTPAPGAVPRLLTNPGSQREGRFRIDVVGNKLVEDDTLAPNLHLRRVERKQQLLHNDKLLAEREGYLYTALSPDGKQLLYTGGYPAREMIYYDLAAGAARTVAKGWFDTNILWVADAGLQPTGPPPIPSSPPKPPATWPPPNTSPSPIGSPSPPKTPAPPARPSPNC